jgi:solute carrier family 25 protein 34/35
MHRLGIYTTALEYELTKTKDGRVSIIKSAFFGGLGGTLGQMLANPFFMVRNQLQSAAAKTIAVGYQHNHLSMTSALFNIYKNNGIRGLYRNVLITIPRGFSGSGSQIATFSYTKDLLQRKSNLDPAVISLISGCIAGTVMTVVMNPTDVISTRLYNQGTNKHGHGLYYSGVIDCFLKIIKVEGIRGLYKGFWPHYVRMGPHSTLVLLFFDELKALKEFTFPRENN